MNKINAIPAVVAMLAMTACNNGGTVLTPPHYTTGAATQYTQIERLSRPAIKEVFESFQHHQISNAVEPYSDSTIQSDIVTTEDAVRPPNPNVGTSGSDYGKLLATVLYPDEYLVNLNGAAPSGADPYYFLSGEVDNGAFGGRAPNDDVISLELGILFGKTLPALGLQPEDNEENNCLDTENIHSLTDPAKSTTSTFPYMPAPR